jgi:hypothetical protein
MARQTVLVKFPNGEREVNAYVETILHYSDGDGYAIPTFHTVLKPSPIDGYIFLQTIDGWYAYRETNW